MHREYPSASDRHTYPSIGDRVHAQAVAEKEVRRGGDPDYIGEPATLNPPGKALRPLSLIAERIENARLAIIQPLTAQMHDHADRLHGAMPVDEGKGDAMREPVGIIEYIHFQLDLLDRDMAELYRAANRNTNIA